MKNDPRLIEGLRHLLADTYLLYLKTQNFHWNVKGINFFALHQLFETQYNQLSDAVDVIAERIRALHASAPGSFAEFLKLASLHEASNETSANEMLSSLLKDHESMAAALAKLCAIASELGDEVTLDILIQRETEHDKTAWMLQSSLEK